MAKKSNKTFPLEDILQTEIKSLQDCMFQMSHVDRSIFLKMFLSCETCHYFLDNIIRWWAERQVRQRCKRSHGAAERWEGPTGGLGNTPKQGRQQTRVSISSSEEWAETRRNCLRDSSSSSSKLEHLDWGHIRGHHIHRKTIVCHQERGLCRFQAEWCQQDTRLKYVEYKCIVSPLHESQHSFLVFLVAKVTLEEADHGQGVSESHFSTSSMIS